MSLPVDSLVEPPPMAAFDNPQFEASRDDLDGVIRVWLSSIRPTYRRAVRGRSSLRRTSVDVEGSQFHGRHRAQ